MSIQEKIATFSNTFGRTLQTQPVKGRPPVTWRYYRLGTGPAVLWLTGGIRRAALGFSFLELLAEHHTVIAPDYPPVMTFADITAGIDAILAAEGVTTCSMCGQSYGGVLAQGYLALRPASVERLVLSSTGPADYGSAWKIVDGLAVSLARLLPEAKVKRMLAGGVAKLIHAHGPERDEWLATANELIERSLSRADIVSHFAVAGDLVGRKIVRQSAFEKWKGSVTVLAAENDPTQSPRDIPAFTRLFGRTPKRVSLGNMGHAAAMFEPERYVAILEEALEAGL